MSTLRQQIIESRVEELVEALSIPEDEAFERLVHSIVLKESVYALNADDCVDGSQDKQIDIISIDSDEKSADIYIISVKFIKGFKSNAIILMKNGINWIFNKSRKELDSLKNQSFKDKILDIKSIISSFGPSNIYIHCYFATNGQSDAISQEYQQEVDSILAEYNNNSFGAFSFESLGADELVECINATEKNSRSLDSEIPIRYDANTPSLIRYHSQGLKGIVCTASARDIAELVNKDENGAVFDSNIRRYLGKGRSVNADIIKTASDVNSSYLFWFLNNGITIVCDSCDPVTDPDSPKVKIKNMQIVNGCQTASALASAAKDGILKPDTRVILKIFETNDSFLASRIVLTTNNQNRINSRDLKANDAVQQDMQRAFAKYQILYEHKVNQYKFSEIPNDAIVITNEEVGQSYLAIALKKPSDASRRKYKVWSENYKNIFTGSNIEPHIICVLIERETARWAMASLKDREFDDVRRKLLKNGKFHIARIASYYYRDTDSFLGLPETLQESVSTLRDSPNILQSHLEIALERLHKIIINNPVFKADIDAALKSSLLDSEITRTIVDDNT